MQIESLKEVMEFHLSNFNDEQVEITEDTVHSEVVSMTDGYPGTRSAQIYKNLVRWTINKNGDEVKEWPEDWLGQSVKALASVLVCLLFIISTAFSQPLTVTLGAAKTELDRNAIAIAIDYLPSLGLTGKEKIKYGNNSVISIMPQVQMATGTEDAFSSITAKITALAIFFKTTEVGGLTTPDSRKTMHTLPVSAGVETSNRFNFINALAEIGYVPWYQGGNTPLWLKRTKVGVFAQLGYKFRLDSTGNGTEGGQVDESEEPMNTGIMRLKASAGIDSKPIFKIQAFKVGVVGNADLWLDLFNSATYYRIQGAVRVYLGDENYLDLGISEGSGAPLFNQGEQFSAGLTITF